MRSRIRLCLIGMAACLIFAAVWAAVAVPMTALADKPDKPPGQDEESVTVFTVELASHEGLTFESPTYLPTCDAQTSGRASGKYYALFPRHDLGATVFTSTGYTLTDDIVLVVNGDGTGRIVSLQLFGQDLIGKEGVMHQSELVEFDPPVVPSDGGFTLHVDVDQLPIWKTNHHLRTKRPRLVEMVGTISIADMVYTPLP